RRFSSAGFEKMRLPRHRIGFTPCRRQGSGAGVGPRRRSTYEQEHMAAARAVAPTPSCPSPNRDPSPDPLLPSISNWSLDSLRAAPVLGFALVMLAAVLVAEGLHRLARLPRASGHMLVGAIASPIALGLFGTTDLDPWKPLIDLAIGVLVFELGSRVQPRWL